MFGTRRELKGSDFLQLRGSISAPLGVLGSINPAIRVSASFALSVPSFSVRIRVSLSTKEAKFDATSFRLQVLLSSDGVAFSFQNPRKLFGRAVILRQISLVLMLHVSTIGRTIPLAVLKRGMGRSHLNRSLTAVIVAFRL